MRAALSAAALVLATIALVTTQPAATDCMPTQPNHHRMPSSEMPAPNGWYGNDLVGTDLGTDGTVVFRPGGPGFVLRDGSLQMKFLWFKAPKPMTIRGRRLDGKPVALRSFLAPGHDKDNYQPSDLVFATPGCWEVTARIDGTELTFVTKVVKIGN